MNRIVRRGVAVVATLLACVLSSCSITGVSGPHGEDGDGTGTINALFMKQAGYSEQDIEKMIDAFEQKNPDITVVPTFVSYEALHDKIVTSAAAGTYDVELIDVIWPAEFASKGLLADLTDRIPTSWSHKMFKGALGTAEYKHKYYGVPWGPSTKFLYYNSAMLKKVGATPADLDTWSGVLKVAAKMKREGVSKYPIAWSWAQAEALVCDYAQILGAFGGRFTDDDGNLIVNDKAGVKALTWMKKTLDDKLSNPASTTFLEDDVSKSMAQGDTAFSLNWDSTYRDLNDKSISKIVGKNGVLPTPKGPSGQRPGVNGAMALSISSNSKNQDAAWKFIKYATSEANQERFIKSSATNWNASYDKPKVVAENRPIFTAYKTALKSTILRPPMPDYNTVSQALQVELQQALLGEKSPQEALDDAVEEANED